MITLEGNRLTVASRTTIIEWEGIRLRKISAADGRVYLCGDETVPPLELLAQDGSVYALGTNPLCRVAVRLLSDTACEITMSDWNADVSLRISIDPKTEEICVEPSCHSMMTGLFALRLNLSGIDEKTLRLVVPLQQGACLPVSHPLIRGRRHEWPNAWEAGFAALQGEGGGLGIYTEDADHCGKAIKTGDSAAEGVIGLETMARGPLESVRAIGGLVWRFGCYQGGWQVPVLRYRDWYRSAYHIAEKEALRPDWLRDIRLAVSWCPTDQDLLEALARRVDPRRVFLHVPYWRAQAYDQDYPVFHEASPAGRAFIEKARRMGFHVAPHCNLTQISPDHPLFPSALPFTNRHSKSKRLLGWSWLPLPGMSALQGPPQSHSAIAAHKGHNVLVNMHLGWSGWRREVAWEIAQAVRALDLDAAFVDVAQWLYDGDAATVENMTDTQGALRLLSDLCALRPGFCLSGEGRNEINAQYLSVCQLHLFDMAHTHAIDGRSVAWLPEITLPIAPLLFDGLSRGIGYYYDAKTPEDRKCLIDATAALGAVPTLILTQTALDSDEARAILRAAADL